MAERGTSSSVWGDFGWGEPLESVAGTGITTKLPEEDKDQFPEEYRPYVYVRPPTLKESKAKLKSGFGKENSTSPLSRMPAQRLAAKKKGLSGIKHDPITARSSRTPRRGTDQAGSSQTSMRKQVYSS